MEAVRLRYEHYENALFSVVAICDFSEPVLYIQVIKTFSMREGWWYIGIKSGGGVKSKRTRLVIENEK